MPLVIFQIKNRDSSMV